MLLGAEIADFLARFDSYRSGDLASGSESHGATSARMASMV
jgi:hypothetical protein